MASDPLAPNGTLTGPATGQRRDAGSTRAGLALVSVPEGGDGISYVGRLLERATLELTGRHPLVVKAVPRSGIVRWPEKLRFLGRFAAAAAAGGADWWIFNHLGVARAVGALPPRYRPPYAIFLMGIEAWDPSLSPATRRILREARLRIAISEFTARRVAETHPDVGPIDVCPLALLPDEPAATGSADPALLARVGDQAVLIVGRMSSDERYKGHDELLEAWPAVLRRCPGAQLVIAGRGDDAERLRGKTTALGLADSVLFTGFVSDVTLRALFARAALFAMPSRGEGFGLVYLEAMRAATPCIGSREDAAGELIADGENGFLVDPERQDQLAARIVDLLEDPLLRRRLGEAGRARFERSYSFPRFSARLGEVLSRLR